MIAHLIFSFFTSGTSSLIKPNINNSYLFLQSSYFYIKIFIAFKSYHRDGWPCKPSLLYNYYYHLTHTHTHTQVDEVTSLLQTFTELSIHNREIHTSVIWKLSSIPSICAPCQWFFDYFYFLIVHHTI